MANSSTAEKEMKHHVHTINGIPLPISISTNRLDTLKTMEVFPDDVWIVTYPRSGTTWTQQIVRSIFSKKEDESLTLDMAIPYLELANSGMIPYNVDITSMTRPRSFKSHMPYSSMPCDLPSNTPCKYIYVVRNPKDVAVSLYYHYFSLRAAENFDWNIFISWFLSGEVIYGDYFDHVLSWWEHRNDANVLFLKYEDMKKDLRSSVVQIASFINKQLSEEEIDSVVDKCTFSSMQSNPTTNYEWIAKGHRHQDATPFLRKGKVGGWREHFSSEQAAKFDTLYEKKLKLAGLELRFD